MSLPRVMEASRDGQWLLGEPGWWNLGKEMPADFRAGELAPPEGWVSSTPRVGNFGWIRQRYRPLAWSLLRPMAWAPVFLVATAFPLAFSGLSPNNQGVSLALFASAWALVIIPLLMARNAQPMSDGSILSLPVDWISLGMGAALFPFHILVDARLGWASYSLFWIAYIRTVLRVQEVMKTPPGRFMLPVNPEDWGSEMPEPWELLSESWARRPIASARCSSGRLVMSGVSRGGEEFLALALIHDTGFVLDPFHESLRWDVQLSKLLEKAPPIIGREWPKSFVFSSE